MRRREIKWLIAIVFIGVLSGMTIKSGNTGSAIISSAAVRCGY